VRPLLRMAPLSKMSSRHFKEATEEVDRRIHEATHEAATGMRSILHRACDACNDFSIAFYSILPDSAWEVIADWRFSVLEFVSTSHFENFLMFCIAISSLSLAAENPLNDPDSYFQGVLFIIDVVVTTIFCFELAMKIFALGLYSSPGIEHGGDNDGYLNSGWNQIDFTVIIVSLVGLLERDSSTLGALKVIIAIALGL
jgi:hypothetical protein